MSIFSSKSEINFYSPISLAAKIWKKKQYNQKVIKKTMKNKLTPNLNTKNL